MITKSELLFGKYIMALNQDKNDIEFRNDDALKRNQIFFDFMQQTFNHLYILYLREGRPFDRYIHEKSIEESEFSGNLKTE